MSGVPDSFDPLEQWKADYNRGGIAPLETLNRLAHMSRFIAGYQSRSTDAHLALFGLTRDPGYLYLAVQIARVSLDDPIGAAIPLFSSALERAEPGTRWHAALQRGQASVLYTHADATSEVGDLRQAATALAELLAVIPADDQDRAAYVATLANARLRTGRLTGDQETLTDALASFEEAVAGFPPEQPGYAELVRDAARAAAERPQAMTRPGRSAGRSRCSSRRRRATPRSSRRQRTTSRGWPSSFLTNGGNSNGPSTWSAASRPGASPPGYRTITSACSSRT